MLRLCSEYLAQKLVCSESFDFVVEASTRVEASFDTAGGSEIKEN